MTAMEPVFEPAVAEMSRPVIARTALSRGRPLFRQLGLSRFSGDICLSGIDRAKQPLVYREPT
jgi:hypothetical protein